MESDCENLLGGKYGAAIFHTADIKSTDGHRSFPVLVNVTQIKRRTGSTTRESP